MTTPQQSPSHPKYRPDIDGLRAIAVVSVVAYHALPSLLPGGFIGVDIFFVISGFLITTILLQQLETGDFSSRGFYERRIRRIFPALIVVLLAALGAGWFLLLSDEYAELGKQTVGGSAFVANLVFWGESGYFDSAAETKPLLHLWSLGIEEQFYIFWPLLLALAWRRRWPVVRVLWALAVVSFLVNVTTVHPFREAAFYSPASRFWELMVGGILACMKHAKPVARDAWRSHAQSVLGLGLIATGLVVMRSDRAFPGWWALLPTLGAASCIAAGPTSVLNRWILACRPMVWIGLISYPLYLWHWPLLAFPRIVESQTPPQWIRLAAATASFLLAWLTYEFLEKRIRNGRSRWPQIVFLAGSMSVLACMAFLIYQQDGLPFRKSAQLQAVNVGDIGHDTFHEYLEDHFHPCTPISIRQESLTWGKHIRCFQSKADTPISIAVVGDSHAEHLFVGLAESAPNKNISYYISDSTPYIGNKSFERIYNHVIGDPNINTVVIAALWKERLGLYGPELKATIERLTAANKNVYLVDDVPSFSFDPKKCKFARAFSSSATCSEPRAFFDASYKYYMPVLESAIAGNSRAKMLDISEYLCDEKMCSMTKEGELLYRDNHHLNVLGSKYIGKKMLDSTPSVLR
ncbi:MAG: acyltransferase [Variovorax sp.]|nr:acyltransferase [Variovorax sp.]